VTPKCEIGDRVAFRDLDDEVRTGTVVEIRDDWIGWAVIERDEPGIPWKTCDPRYNCPTPCLIGPA